MLASLLLLIFFCVSFEIYAMRNKDTSSLGVKAVTGVWLGCIAIALMHFKIRYGVVEFDFRTVVLCLSGIFFGTTPTLAALAISIGFITLSSIGTMPTGSLIAECTYTVAAGAAGSILHDLKRRWERKKSLLIIAIAIGITQAIMALCLYITDTMQSNPKDHLIIIAIIQPVVTFFIGILTVGRIKHFNTERKLHLLEDKYNKLILCNDDIFWEFDASGKAIYVSDNVTNAIGYQPKELLGHMPYYIMDDVPSVRAIAEYGKNNEKPGRSYLRKQLVIKHKEGNNVYCDARIMSIIDPGTRRTSGFLCVTRNITNAHLHNELSKHNQKFIREQTARLYEQQKEITEYKKQLASAHNDIEEARKQSLAELTQQMTVITNICNEMTPTIEDIKHYITVLNDKTAAPEKKEVVLQQLLHTTDFISTFSRDLTDTTDLAKGITKVSLSIENIEKLINDICDYHNTRNTYLLKKPIILQREIDLRPEEKTIKADTRHLRRIISILIANSYVFTNTGQITVKCSLKSDTELLVSVSDTGIGVPEAAYKDLFKPFSEYDMPEVFKKSLARHSGLGLSISKSLVELMGGRIWFTSAIGKGTTISFTIPYIKASEIASETNAQYHWEGRTALIATQNRFNGILVSETLAKTHIKYRSIHIDDFNAPLESEYFRNYDIIVTDCTKSDSAALQAIVQKYPSAAVIVIDDHATATTICKEIDKKLTETS